MGGGASLGMPHNAILKKYLRLLTKSRCDDDIKYLRVILSPIPILWSQAFSVLKQKRNDSVQICSRSKLKFRFFLSQSEELKIINLVQKCNI